MVVIGRGEGEFLHAKDEAREEQRAQYADKDTVLKLASQIAASNSELMHRLA